MINAEKTCKACPVHQNIKLTIELLLMLFIFSMIGTEARANSGLAEYDQPWELCALCHSLDGNSHMAKFPKLAGQPAAYIQKQLHDFLQGKRSNDGGQMSAIVTEVNVGDIVGIAQWFASQEPPLPAESDVDLGAGKQLYSDLECAACHVTGESLNNNSRVPYLTSQHAGYLAKQLMNFQQGSRLHISDESINQSISQLTVLEIEQLTTYLAATARE